MQVNLSADKSTCTCPHCVLNNGTLCMFDAARRCLTDPKPSDVSVDRLELSQLGWARRLLNPQLYDDESPAAVNDSLAASDVERGSAKSSASTAASVLSCCQDESQKVSDAVPSLVSPVACQQPVSGLKSATDVVSIIQAVREADRELSESTSDNPAASDKGGVPSSNGKKQPSIVGGNQQSDEVSNNCGSSKSDSRITVDSSKTDVGKAESCKQQATRVAMSCKSAPSIKSDSSSAASCKHSTTSCTEANSASTTNGLLASSKSTGSQSKCTGASNTGSSSQCKDATLPSTQCCGGKHPVDLSHSESTGCSADGGRSGGKDGGKFCECWHCEFFGHTLVSE